jgi:alpha-beta hydrolase superfamily lysophospholipase
MRLEVIADAENEVRSAPILFVHGAWHAAWCWENFLPYFAQQGYASYAVSLRGHGASEGRDKIRWHSAAHDYVADVAQVVQTLARPPILVGHSMGGYVVQKYLETHTAAAGVLLASVPVAGILGFGLRFGMRHPWPFLKANLLLNPWHLVGTPELMRESFFSPQVSAQDLARHFARLQPESFRAELETMLLNLPRPDRVKTPMLVLGAANDRVFSVGEAQATARAYGTEAEMFPDMAHDMMLEPNWKRVADRVLSWIQEHGL